QDGVGAPFLVPVPDEELKAMEGWGRKELLARVNSPWIERLSDDEVDAFVARADELEVNFSRKKVMLLGAVQRDDNRTIYKWFDGDVAYVAPPVAARERTSEVRAREIAAMVSSGTGAVAVPPPSRSSVVRTSQATRSAGGVPWIFQPRFIEPWTYFGDDTHEAFDIFKSTLLSEKVGNPNLMSQHLAPYSAAESATEREAPVQTWALMYHDKVLAHGLHPVIEHLSRG
ncbi:Hypothetical Protein FCC1311_115892, partial [Hondaea fermentalgiana]